MRRSKPIVTQPGYVQYLRTSDEDVQSPERSQDGQRRDIAHLLQGYPTLPYMREYVDNYSGTSRDRGQYQAMLADGRRGLFSHVFASVPDRFGRDDVEALRAIDELTALGVCVRFAGHPDLDPSDEDDRLYLNILFGMAKREAAVIARRCRNGMLSKLLKGGWPWHAPVGYVNREIRLSELGEEEKLKHARYKRWVELDPEQATIWRYAWQLLLTDRLTLADICEKIHERAYRLPSGKPFVMVSATGSRQYPIAMLSRVFHHWFYAGWVICDNDWAQIQPKTVRGEWEAMVSTEDFERGLAILAQRNHKPVPYKKFFYLLQGLIYLQPDKGPLRKLTCGTPNANRARGGVAYYCLPSSNSNFLCRKIDDQIPVFLQGIQVNALSLNRIRALYHSDVSRFTSNAQRESKHLQQTLKRLDEKEVNMWRAFTEHGMRPEVYEKLAREYREERERLEQGLVLQQQASHEVIEDLEAALQVISTLADIYPLHPADRQRAILKQLVNRIVISTTGQMIRIELKAPFEYLHQLNRAAQQSSGRQRSGNMKRTSQKTGSFQLTSGDPGKIRTYDQVLKRHLLYR